MQSLIPNERLCINIIHISNNNYIVTYRQLFNHISIVDQIFNVIMFKLLLLFWKLLFIILKYTIIYNSYHITYPPGSNSITPSSLIHECAKIWEILKRRSGSTTNMCLINFSQSKIKMLFILHKFAYIILNLVCIYSLNREINNLIKGEHESLH